MTQIRASAPVPGAISTITPKITDSAPAKISHHSLSISFRSWIAPMISKMPCAIAQPPMKKIRTSAVTPGHRK